MPCLKMLEWTCLSVEQVLDKCGIPRPTGQPAGFWRVEAGVFQAEVFLNQRDHLEIESVFTSS